MPPIKKLPPKVQSALQTGITITGVSRCVLELVQNSLDAGATSVLVNINLNTFKIIVTDNGIGLTRSDLSDIGKRYMTSKCKSLNDLKTRLKYYGFKGEALASIREYCRTLTVISKAKGSTSSLCKVFINGVDSEKVERSEQDLVSHGTTVIVEDFLYSQPVRRNRIKPALEMERIRKTLFPLALINYQVTFTVTNDITNKVVLKSLPTESIERAFQNLCETKASKELVPVKAVLKKFRVSGFVSKLTVMSNKYQLVYVNKRFMKKSKIHMLINKCLAKSFYFKGISFKQFPKSKQHFNDDVLPNHKDTNAVFIINIECPVIEYDVCFSPEKTVIEFRNWSAVSECVEKAIDCFSNEEPKKINSLKLNKYNEKRKSHTELVEQVIEQLKKTTRKDVKKLNKKSCKQEKNNLLCLFKKPEHKINYFSQKNLLKNESENPFTSSIDSNQIVCRKKRKFTDHVITESETDETPYKQQVCGKKLKLNNVNNLQRKSILPVVSQVFYKRNIHEIQSDLKVMKENNKALNISSGLCKTNSNFFKNFNKDCITTKVNIRRKVDFKVDFSFNSSVGKVQNNTADKYDFCIGKPILKRPSNSNISYMDFNISNARIKNDTRVVKQISNDCTVMLNSTELQVRNVKFNDQNTGKHNLFASPLVFGKYWSPDMSGINKVMPDEEHISHPYINHRITRPLYKMHDKNELFVSNMRTGCYGNKNTNHNCRNDGCGHTRQNKEENILNENKTFNNNHHSINNNKYTLNQRSKEVSAVVQFGPQMKNSSVFPSNYTNQTFSHLNKNVHRESLVTNNTDYNADKYFTCKPQEHLLFKKIIRSRKEIVLTDTVHSPYFKNIGKQTSDFKNEKLCISQSHTKNKDYSNASSRGMNRGPDKRSRSEKYATLDENDVQTNRIHPNRCVSTGKENTVIKQDGLFLTHMLRSTVIIVDLNSPIYDTIQQENKIIHKVDQQIDEKKYFETRPVNTVHNSHDNAKFVESKSFDCQKQGHAGNDTKNTIKCNSTVEKFKNIPKDQEVSFSAQTVQDNTNINNELNKTIVYDSFLSPILQCDCKMSSTHKEDSANIFTNEDGDNKMPNGKQLSLLSPDIIEPSYFENQVTNTKGTTEHILTPQFASKHKIGEHFFTDTDDDRATKKNVSVISQGFMFAPHSDNQVTNTRRITENIFTPLINQFASTHNGFRGEDGRKTKKKLGFLPTDDTVVLSDSENHAMNTEETTECIFTPITNQFNNSHLLSEEHLLSSVDNNIGNKYKTHSVMHNSDTMVNVRESNNDFKFSPVYKQHIWSHISFEENNTTEENDNRLSTVRATPNLNTCNNDVQCFAAEPEKSEKTSANKFDNTNHNGMEEDNNVKLSNKENYDNTYTSPVGETQWLKQTLPNGVKVYVHSKTGMSSYFTPVALSNEYTMKKRRWFMPKGTSPLADHLKKDSKEIRRLNDHEKNALQEAVFMKTDVDELSYIKWKGCKPHVTGSEDILSKLICEAKIPDDVTKLMQEGRPVIFNKLIHNLQLFTKSYVFTGDSFLTAQVIGQVDSKFIATVVKDKKHGELLVLLDQHAVDERIQFEKLIADYKRNSGQMVMSTINPGITVALSKAELQLISYFKTHFERNGLQIAVHQNQVDITSVPTCLYNRSMKEGNNQSSSVLKNLIVQLIKEELECLQETKGVGAALPNVIHTVISYEACRGAVKFGDKLSTKCVENLLRQLARCSLPFQCAHGRPVLVPLVSLDNIQYKAMRRKPNLEKLQLICVNKNKKN